MSVETAVAVAAPEPGAPAREPWLGVNLSLCLPGLGDWYAGSRVAGALQMGAALILMVAGAWFALAPGPNGAVGLILLIGLVPLWLFGAWSAYRSCRARATPEFEALRRSQTDAWMAVFFSRVVPGLGQFYDRRFVAGALFVIAALASLPIRGTVGSLLGGTLATVASLDAGLRARGRGVAGRVLWGIAAVIWIYTSGAQLAAMWTRAKVVQAFRVPSNSMAPALVRGDHVLADMRARGAARIGDMVVVAFPGQAGQRFVKRVFALAGDQVEFRGDGAYRNGRRVLDGAFQSTTATPLGYGREGEPYRVPPGAVFVLADDPGVSNDSRHLGPVPLDAVFGRVYKTYWPPARARTFRRMASSDDPARWS